MSKPRFTEFIAAHMAKTYVQVVIGAASMPEGRDGVMGEAGDDSSSSRLWLDSFGDILQSQEPKEIRFLKELGNH